MFVRHVPRRVQYYLVNARYELFDHTADMGIRIFAPTMGGLVEPASQGLYAVIGELASRGGAEPVSFDLTGNDPAVLLRDYLGELLLLLEVDGRIVTRAQVTTFANGRLAVEAQAAPVDDEESIYAREVKAITYHELEIREIPGGYQATVIVDI